MSVELLNPRFNHEQQSEDYELFLIASKDIYKGDKDPATYGEVENIPRDLTFDQIAVLGNDSLEQRLDLRFAELPGIVEKGFIPIFNQIFHEKLHPLAKQIASKWFIGNTFNLFDPQVECIVMVLE